ncbi:outer membrane protein assembly factor BamA [Altericroceibacterium spongiae]|uniref:Outer membrane protein assembly factor BamA n=1 Tax=Altericroceibacterium spongiae TaxID=2320269 RepID=A0A420EMN5_9SPHN|nr:outer membrane protein assembly factor BamA [Altericroceibacterium spongiae]RKF21979.1 outer membrane protein assembly factor BamA [Altericroceibacterium spongiae]
MSRKATTTIAASQFAAALMGCTMLAGVPAAAYAQDEAAEGNPAAPEGASSQDTPDQTSSEQAGQTIRSLTVVGAERLEPDTVLSYIQLRVGGAYTAAAADQALKDLSATELFSDFSIRNDNGNVVIEVKENPIINRIVLEGNKKLKDDKILPEIHLAARQIFTRSKVRADVARIIELYKRQGRFAATVEPKMVMLDQNRVDIIFEITEGPKSKVRQINIIGNDAFSDGDLKGEMYTKETGFLKIFSSNTSYDPDRMAADQQQLRQFYLTQGYADFRVVSAVAELTPDKKDFIITYVVEEGKRYKFGDVKVESQLRDFDSDRLTSSLPMHKGDWYNAKTVEDTVESLTESAGAYGYAFANVQPQFSRNRDDLTMDVTFTIAEAPRVYIQRIDVNGNTLTQDKVVRREFRVAEGDAFNSLAVKRSTARINSLGYFQENFEINQVQGDDPGSIVLEANVQEQPTGELTLSAGFSSLESFILSGSIRQRNFRGRGQTVGLSANFSSYSRSASVSFTEPYLFDKNISTGIDIYRREYDNDYYNNDNETYSSATTGFQARVGVPLTEYLSVLGRYTLNFDDISLDENTFYTVNGDGDFTCDPILAGRYLCEAVGKRTTSMVGASLIYSNLDSRVRPTRGERATLSADFAGLGGDVRYARIRGDAAKYWNVGSGFIFSVTGEGGYIKGLKDRGEGENDVLLTDRFFLGEPQIRGFDIRGIGPRVLRVPYLTDEDGNQYLADYDANSVTDDALGGNAYYMARAELEIPLGSGAREMGLRPSIFVDAGSVFSLKAPRPLVDQPGGYFIPTRNSDGAALCQQTSGDESSVVTCPSVPDGGQLPDGVTALGRNISPFKEVFVGNTAKPRVAVGFGVDWNSPFGPFRINVSYPLLKYEGDDTKTFSFNVGTQF